MISVMWTFPKSGRCALPGRLSGRRLSLSPVIGDAEGQGAHYTNRASEARSGCGVMMI